MLLKMVKLFSETDVKRIITMLGSWGKIMVDQRRSRRMFKEESYEPAITTSLS